MTELLDSLAGGKIKPGEAERIRLDEIAPAHGLLTRAGYVGKVVLFTSAWSAFEALFDRAVERYLRARGQSRAA